MMIKGPHLVILGGVKNLCYGLVLLLALTPTPVWSSSANPIHHKLQIELEPSTRFAKIEDTVQFKNGNCEAFYLHPDLKLAQVPAGWQAKPSENRELLKIEFIKNTSTHCPETVTLNYSGVLHDPSMGPEDSSDSSGFFFYRQNKF